MADCFKLLHFHLGSQITEHPRRQDRAERGRPHLHRASQGAAPGCSISTSAAAWAWTTTARRPTSSRSINYTLAGVRQRRRLPHPERLRRSRRPAPDHHLRERAARWSPTTACWCSTSWACRRSSGDGRHPAAATRKRPSSRCSTSRTTYNNLTTRQRARELTTTRQQALDMAMNLFSAATCRSTSGAWPRSSSGRSARRSAEDRRSSWTRSRRSCKGSTRSSRTPTSATSRCSSRCPTAGRSSSSSR